MAIEIAVIAPGNATASRIATVTSVTQYNLDDRLNPASEASCVNMGRFKCMNSTIKLDYERFTTAVSDMVHFS